MSTDPVTMLTDPVTMSTLFLLSVSQIRDLDKVKRCKQYTRDSQIRVTDPIKRSVSHFLFFFSFSARKRSLRRLCFHRCLFVHGGGAEGMRDRDSVRGRGLGGMHGWRGMCGWGCAFVAGRGVCMAGGHAWQERQPLQQAVHILLECILVFKRNCEDIKGFQMPD